MLTFSQEYTSDEMEAAYALLALKNSAQNSLQAEASHQAPTPTTGSQVSPLVEVACFSAAVVTDKEQIYVLIDCASSYHYVSLNYFQAIGCNLCTCLVNVMSVCRQLFTLLYSL